MKKEPGNTTTTSSQQRAGQSWWNEPLLITRLGLGLLFLWFGVHKIIAPEEWIAWIPKWALIMPAEIQLMLHGTAELILGTMLVIGLFTRIAAIAAALILAAVIVVIGWNDIAARDAAILAMAIALAMAKKHPYSLDSRRGEQP